MANTVLIQIDCDSELAIANHYGLQLPKEQIAFVYYRALEKLIDLLNQYKLKATLFVIGIDLMEDYKCDIIKKALQGGHEIANHTFHHPRQLLQCSDDLLSREIEAADDIIKRKLGVIPLGFRAPNFEADSRIINILNKMNYRYDCSILPTPYLPLLQHLKKKASLSSSYMGKPEYVFAPKHPYIPRRDIIWKADNAADNGVLELPISTFPGLKFPCHSSYLLAIDKRLCFHVLNNLIRLYQLMDAPLIYIFHLTDIIDNQYLFGTEKKYYKSLKERLFFVNTCLQMFARAFTSCTTIEYLTLLNYERR